MSWDYFSDSELACKGSGCCGGNSQMNNEFMQKIVRLRKLLGFPFKVTSAYRCPIHNSKVSSTGENGPHTTGRAIDIACWSDDAFKIIDAAIKYSVFTGIGVSQKGNTRFIHLDDIPRVKRRVWSY